MLCVLVASLLPNLVRSPLSPSNLITIQDNSVVAQTAVLKTEKERYQDFFRKELLKLGKTENDYLIMKEVIFCESSWRQFENGKVIVVNGNVGLGQVNIIAHQKEYNKMGLDIYEPYNNLSFTAWLYANEGLTPWKEWSGKCFMPRIQNYL